MPYTYQTTKTPLNIFPYPHILPQTTPKHHTNLYFSQRWKNLKNMVKSKQKNTKMDTETGKRPDFEIPENFPRLLSVFIARSGLRSEKYQLLRNRKSKHAKGTPESLEKHTFRSKNPKYTFPIHSSDTPSSPDPIRTQQA